MSSKKVISINPEFFTLSSKKPKKDKGSNKKTQKRNRTKQKAKQLSLKPNKIKKDLLKKIKEYQKKQKTKQLDGSSNGDDVPTSEMSFTNAMESLEQIIKTKKQEKRKKKQIKQKKHKQQVNGVIDAKKERVTRENMQKMHKNGGYRPSTGNIAQSLTNVRLSNIEHQTQENILHTPHTHSNPNVGQSSRSLNPLIKPDPPFGCLKGGKKKTYRQYYKNTHNKTLRRQTHSSRHSSKNSIKIEPTSIPLSNTIPEKKLTTRREIEKNLQNEARKQKLVDFKKKYMMKQRVHDKKYKKKYKIHTYRKTYKLGKKGNKINVLIKNNKTRKKVKTAVDAIDKTPLLEVKKYLKKHNLIKTGTPAPEYVLREMYRNVMLAGDIYNKNEEVLVHNYFNES
jgi:hypothetical protein